MQFETVLKNLIALLSYCYTNLMKNVINHETGRHADKHIHSAESNFFMSVNER